MKKVVWVAMVLMVVMAIDAQAQVPPQPAPVNSWVVGADISPGGWVKGDWISSPGTIRSATGDAPVTVDQQKDMWLNLFGGYKPLGKFGGEVRFSKFGMHGMADGSVAQTVGTLSIWGPDDTPKIVSSAPVLNGPVAYTLKSSVKISRVDLLGNYNKGFPRGWFSAFGGVPILRVESMEGIARSQSFLLYARLPNGTLDTKGNREDYSYSSLATTKGTLYGLAGGIESEYCLTSRFVLEGRFGVAVFPWGSANLDGQFSAAKDIYLVNVAGGVTAAPTQTIAKLNWAPNAAPYSEAVKQTVTAVDVKAGVKWRVGVGKRASLNLGAGISGSFLRNLPLAPAYIIKDPLAVGAGKFNSRTVNISTWAPVITIGVWF